MRDQPTFRPNDRAALRRAGPSQPRVGLVIVACPVAGALGRIVALGVAPVVLNRVSDDVGEDDWMSRDHATVRLVGGQVHVRDGTALEGGWKASANGTFVDDTNDHEVPAREEVKAEVGHVIRTGRTLWMVVEAAAAAPSGSLLAGVSDAIARVRDELRLVVAEVALRFERHKRVTQALLVTGPRGTGKQVVAREAHRLLSERRGDVSVPFVDVPAPAMADGTAAADIFGVVDKYATDVKGRPGFFERAHGGVLLIDEVADLPLGEQAKLLGVLEERQVTRLGAKSPTSFDCLVIAATNRDLEAMVRAGGFRADLLDRLSRFHVHLPGLGERVEDVLPITSALLHRHGYTTPLPWDVALRLLGRAWEGNIRELDAFLERLIALARDGQGDIDLAVLDRATRGLRSTLRTNAVPSAPATISATSATGAASSASDTGRGQSPPREELLKLLEDNGWNKTEVGRILGKHPRQITRWMEYLGIVRP